MFLLGFWRFASENEQRQEQSKAIDRSLRPSGLYLAFGSGGRCTAGFDARAKEGDEKVRLQPSKEGPGLKRVLKNVGAAKEDVPRRLKP